MKSIIKILFNSENSRYLTVFFDISLVVLSLFLTSFFFNELIANINLKSILILIFLTELIFYLCGIYKITVRYISIADIKIIIFAILIKSSILILINSLYYQVNYGILILYIIFFLNFTSFYRILVKITFSNTNKEFEGVNIMLFGAGQNGILLKRALYNQHKYNILGFIDDDKSKVNKSIDGLKVYEIGNKLESLFNKKKISIIVFATTKLTSVRSKYLYKYFKDFNIKIKAIPNSEFFVEGLNINKASDIQVEDLLSRDEIIIDIEKNKKVYSGKNILVTGSAGSIGSEIVKQLLKFSPKKIFIVDQSETAMFYLMNDLKSYKNLKFIVDDISKYSVVKKIFVENKIDIVFHAAAYKHVGVMEVNPFSAIKNNIGSTINLIDFSINNNVKKFIYVSTDKAVNPTNVMGASKRASELYLLSNLKYSENTQLIITRFGNVLGSNGSVVPIFKNQIDRGGPVTITHPDIERYFMTISEATSLVLEAGSMANGGEIFLFDMGKPVKINDLAKNMIKLSGFTETEIKIKYTGLRSGEKLYEELLVKDENQLKTYNPLIYIAKKTNPVNKSISIKIKNIVKKATKDNTNKFDLIKDLKNLIPEYISNKSEFEKIDKIK